MQSPFFTNGVSVTEALAVSEPNFVGYHRFEDGRGFGQHGGTLGGVAHTFWLGKGGNENNKLLPGGAARLPHGATEEFPFLGRRHLANLAPKII